MIPEERDVEFVARPSDRAKAEALDEIRRVWRRSGCVSAGSMQAILERLDRLDSLDVPAPHAAPPGPAPQLLPGSSLADPKPSEPCAPAAGDVMPPIMVSRAEAARLLGVSLRHFEVRVMPRIKTVKVGRSRLIPVAELRRYVEAKQS